MSRKQPKRTAGNVAVFALAGFFVLTVMFGIGLGVASAGSADELAKAGAFGFDETTTSATVAKDSSAQTTTTAAAKASAVTERSVLAALTTRDITSGFQMIDDMEEAERQRILAENAAGIARMKAMKAKQGEMGSDVAPEEDATEYGLPAVNWTVGKAAFVAEWTARIDAYLAGSALDGYGYAFAEAAWDNGVDPRWSPAISSTESGKGANCFKSCNAWGWGVTGWSDWDTAIRAHVAGLADGYGYSITTSAARAYCPPTYMDWYNKTLGQMALI